MSSTITVAADVCPNASKDILYRAVIKLKILKILVANTLLALTKS